MRKWRVRQHENDGRWYPEYTDDEGARWRLHYVIAQKQGYAREVYARKYAESYVSAGGEWWKEKTVQEELGPEVVAALTAKFEGRKVELEDDMATSEQLAFERRAEFVKWLIEQGKLGEGDMASPDSREPVEQTALFD